MKRNLFAKIIVALFLLCCMGWGYNVTVSTSSNGCSVSPASASVDAGKTVTIKATPDANHYFSSWSISGSCTVSGKKDPTTTLTVNGDCTVKANFVLIYTVTVATNNSSWGSTNVSSKQVSYLGTASFTATPANNYLFTGWTVTSGADKCTLTDASEPTVSVKVSGTCTIQANFAPERTITLSAGTGGTTNFTSKKVQDGTTVSISATISGYGYRFDKWSSSSTSCPVADAKSSSTTVTVKANCTITASFVARNTFGVSAGTGGSISPTGYVTVDKGSSNSIKATPDAGYRFDKWTSNLSGCTIADASSASTTVKVSADCVITASFTKVYNVSSGASGSHYSALASEYAAIGEDVEVSVDKGDLAEYVIPQFENAGYRFVNWTYSSSTASENCKIESPTSRTTKVRVLKGACTVEAKFIKTYSYSLVAGTGGTVSPAGSNVVDDGSVNNIKATPSSGYRFDKWSSSSTSCVVANATSASTTVKVSGDCSVTASFVKTHDVYVYVGLPGVLSFYRKEKVDDGKTLDLSISDFDPDDVDSRLSSFDNTATTNGYEFYEWKLYTNGTNPMYADGAKNCKVEKTGPTSVRLTVNGPCAPVAVYRIKETLTISAGEGGSVSPSGTFVVLKDSSVSIQATAASGYRFYKWASSSASCVVFYEDTTLTTVRVSTNCSVTAQFKKQATVKIINGEGGSYTTPELTAIDEGSFMNISFRALANYQFSHFVFKSGEENCPISYDRYYNARVTANGNCTMESVFVPYFELTKDEKFYRAYTNGEGGSVYIRFHAETEDSSWYYVEMSSDKDRDFSLRNFGSDKWTADSYREYSVSGNHVGVYLKSEQRDLYFTAYITSGRDLLGIKYEKVETDYLDIEYDLAGYIAKQPTIGIAHGMDTLVTAEKKIGFIFKEWKLMDGDCSIDNPNNASTRVTPVQTRCRLRAVYEKDPNANIGAIFYSTSFMNSVQCGYVSLVDSSTKQNGSYTQIRDISLSDVSVAFDGDPLQLYAVGDTFALPIVNSAMRKQIGVDTIREVVQNPVGTRYSDVYTCFLMKDGVLNGDTHTVDLKVRYAGEEYSFLPGLYVEALLHDQDAPDTVNVVPVNGDSAITRNTKVVRIDVATQNFTDDVWFVDYLMIDMPDTPFVDVRCLKSGDEEKLRLDWVEAGRYRTPDFLKNEGTVVKGDGTLTCAAYDKIETEFEDFLYKVITRDTVAFGDVVPVDYKFFKEDLYRDIDSVETTEVNFAFRVTTVSPTMDKADTIMVALFTDAGDTVWTTAVETDIYSNEFEGFGSFKFVTRKADVRDDQLDAAMDFESELNRVVIRLQVGEDNSALDSRDSLVVFYEFIPADFAEIYDKDYDGRADYVRVHFAKSIKHETLVIDSVFWGSVSASGATAAGYAAASGRAVPAENLVFSADGEWIDAALDEPFEYGVTSVAASGKDGASYLRISRKLSGDFQKVPLVDKVGPVPVAAEKHPGYLSDEDFLKGAVRPADTLVITMSEPVDSMPAKACRFASSQKSTSLRKSAGVAYYECTQKDMFLYVADKYDRGERHLNEKSYTRSKSGLVWTFVLPKNSDVKVGSKIYGNSWALLQDSLGNGIGRGEVVVTGEDAPDYLYALTARPSVAGKYSGKNLWIDPASGHWEYMHKDDASIKVESRVGYEAWVSIFDNLGHVVTQFKASFGKKGEKSEAAYRNSNYPGYVSFIPWDMQDDDGRPVATGVYIWKIKFRFEDGHTEWRTIRSGVKR